MRLRHFDAPSVADAMHRMRAALGDDAIILATHELAEGVRLTAAVEVAADDLGALLAAGVPPAVRAAVASCLAHHGVPAALGRALLEDLARTQALEPAAALAQALGARFRFAPLALPPGRPLVVVGPPGAGKTVALVRLAAQALVAGHAVRVVTVDGSRAGAVAQLTTLLQPLRLTPDVVAGSAELASAVGTTDELTVPLIDTTGINSFQGRELVALAELLHASRAEPVLVLPAGLDGEDAIEIAGNFAAIGARRMIVSKLDSARRLGSVLAAADLGLAFAGVGLGREIGAGTTALSAGGLARVLLHRMPLPDRQPDP
jgi:flagellar biosynthesis protein FlhF